MLYKVVAYIRAEGDPEDYTYYLSEDDALSEVDHCKFMQPENIYVVEEVGFEDLPDNPEIHEPPESK